jgi:hypothetical protein
MSLRRLSTLVAACVVIAIFIVVRTYVYTGSNGTVDLAAYTFGGSLLVLIPALIIARGDPSRLRLDVVLWFTAVIMVSAHYKEVFEAVDAYRFKAELKAAGPDKLLEVFENSQTKIARIIRAGMDVTAEDEKKINALFDRLNDPACDAFILPPKVTDRAILQKCHDLVASSLQRMSGILAQIDALMNDEARKAETLLKDASPEFSSGFLGGVADQRAAKRELYQRAVDALTGTYKEMVDFSQFLLTDAGAYEVSPDGQILFATNALADRYNLFLTKLQEASAELQKVHADVAAYNSATVAKKLRYFANSPDR